jgi:hypothetical protein
MHRLHDVLTVGERVQVLRHRCRRHLSGVLARLSSCCTTSKGMLRWSAKRPAQRLGWLWCVPSVHSGALERARALERLWSRGRRVYIWAPALQHTRLPFSGPTDASALARLTNPAAPAKKRAAIPGVARRQEPAAPEKGHAPRGCVALAPRLRAGCVDKGCDKADTLILQQAEVDRVSALSQDPWTAAQRSLTVCRFDTWERQTP